MHFYRCAHITCTVGFFFRIFFRGMSAVHFGMPPLSTIYDKEGTGCSAIYSQRITSCLDLFECLCAQTKCTTSFTFQHLYIFMRLFYLRRCALCIFAIHSWFFHGHTSENNEMLNCFVLFAVWFFFRNVFAIATLHLMGKAGHRFKPNAFHKANVHKTTTLYSDRRKMKSFCNNEWSFLWIFLLNVLNKYFTWLFSRISKNR